MLAICADGRGWNRSHLDTFEICQLASEGRITGQHTLQLLKARPTSQALLIASRQDYSVPVGTKHIRFAICWLVILTCCSRGQP